MMRKSARSAMLAATSFIALYGLVAPAGAQTTQKAPAEPAVPQDEIIVTGSRTVTNGAQAPSPLTVSSSEQLVAAAPGNLADAVVQLPVFSGSFRPSSAYANHSGTGGGANLLTLRGLAPQRTLVLIDGRRVAPTTIFGATDANLVPQTLLSRVEVVTGGASAAYGSDAVAGVVNFILDSKFKGLKGSIQGGLSTHAGDAGSFKASLAYGASLADERLHVVLAADYFNQNGINTDFHGRKVAEQGWGLIPVSATNGQLLLVPNVHESINSWGGTISACQPAGVACPFTLKQFYTDGSLIPFIQGTNPSSRTASGGDGSARRTNLLPSLESKIFFGRANYEASDKLNLMLEANYADVRSHYQGTTNGFGPGIGVPITIFADNAYLQPAIRNQMTANGITSFTLSRSFRDIPSSTFSNKNQTYRLLGGIDGELGGGWKFSSYAQYGKSKSRYLITNNPIIDNFFNAVDAVADGSGNIVCRSTLLGTVAGPGCVPINLFGDGAVTKTAAAYVTDTYDTLITAKQLVMAADVRGSLFSVTSDPVTIAFGAEYRKEWGQLTTDPVGSALRNSAGIRGYPAGQAGRYGGYHFSINGLPLKGSFDIKEAFVELNVPLARDVAFFNALDVNGAVRYADYSTAGGQSTWKIGSVWEPIEGLRLRGTRSRDVRAPNIQELYTVANSIPGVTANDPQKGGARAAFLQRQTGNPNLGVEKADTWTGGVVIAPGFLPGLTASFDYYNIKIKNVITQPSPQDIVNACGQSTNCALVERDSGGNLSVVITPFQNLAQLKTSGEDFELGYNTTLGNGNLGLRLLVSHIDELSVIVNGVKRDRVGDLAVSPSTITLPAGAVEWTGKFSIDYRDDRWHAFMQQRYIGSGEIDKSLVYAPGVNTHVKALTYTDITLGYSFDVGDRKLEVFGTVNNLFDQEPRITPQGTANPIQRSANGSLYDLVGRYITVGAKFQF